MIVAQARSRFGGKLDCGHQAARGELIFKVDTGDRGGTTTHGNGLGGWVCSSCATAVEPDPAA
jgi:hypothetical protein